MCCEEENVMDMESKVGPNDGSIRGWRIWYDDGRSFSSKDTEWENLPKDGVTHFCLYFGHKYTSLIKPANLLSRCNATYFFGGKSGVILPVVGSFSNIPTVLTPLRPRKKFDKMMAPLAA
jgi:hypothetical protein